MAGFSKTNKEIVEIHLGQKVVSAIYKGAVLIWEAALRIWKHRQIWKGKEVWKY